MYETGRIYFSFHVQIKKIINNNISWYNFCVLRGNRADIHKPFYTMADNNNNLGVFLYMGGDTIVPDVDVVRVRVHPSVTVIPESAFYDRQQLQEVECCEGLLEIGDGAFHYCYSLKHINIPSTVTRIGVNVFHACEKLETIQLNEGLLEIGDYAFCSCKSLKAAIIPSTVRTIGRCAFYGAKLSHINLPEGVEIGDSAFGRSELLNCCMPQSITTISMEMFGDCESLFSVELSESTTQIEDVAFDWCHSLRNVALPIDAEIAESAFNCSDLKQLFDTQQQIISALKHRFDNLSIHKIIYYQSYSNLTSDQLINATNMRSGQRRLLRSKLNPTGKEQDCLGMTPLHILACSTVQKLSLYRLLIESYPENLITEDRWGAVPILYAVWGDAPGEIVQYMLKSYQSLYPSYEFNFTSMVKTLGRASAAIEVIQNLVNIKQSFPEQSIDWYLCVEQLTEDRLLRPTEATFRFFVKCSVTKRINAIGLKKLRGEITNYIETIRPSVLSYGNFVEPQAKRAFYAMIQSKLAEYEAEYYKLKEATTILELALWKNNMNNHSDNNQGGGRRNKKIRIGQADLRKQCRINCGADVVIQHVLPYLLPGAAVAQSDSHTSESASDSASDSGIESD